MSEGSAPVEVLFLWHHHQPDYRSPRDRRSLLPWVRLHATKDYLDMALHLERHPTVRATFNFVPSLLDQIDEACAGGADALFDLLARPVASLTPAERAELARRCTQAPRHAFDRWPRYATLVQRLRGVRNGAAGEISNDEMATLEVWFLLAWIDPLFLNEPEAERALAERGEFTEAHRDSLLALHARLLARVLPAYRMLAERGQVELSASAYAHPILPLIDDVRAARRARPDLALPTEPFSAPEDAAAQITRALDRHAAAFGARPAGMWPPEGSVSPEVAEHAARARVHWLATDEEVLWRSLPHGATGREALYRPWRVRTEAGHVALFFRDHELSDRIGFVYHHWDAAEAVADLLARLRRIGRDHAAHGVPLVSIILDGENCWENYPGDGASFLEALYGALESAPDIRTRTPSDVLADGRELALLPTLHSGSWIDADFHIWIGHPEKNRGWDLLARTRRALVEAGRTAANAPEAWQSLFAAEGSDWFWWFGDDHDTADRDVFDRLFREHLQGAWERAGLQAPAWLSVPVVRSARRRALSRAPLGFVHPTLDGRPTHFYEWHAAGRVRLGAGGGSMHRAAGMVRDLYHGFDVDQLYLRLDWTTAPPGEGFDMVLEFAAPRSARLDVRELVVGERPVRWAREDTVVQGAHCAIGTILELGVPFASLGLVAGEEAEMIVRLTRGGETLESIPGDDVVRFTVPDATYEPSMWSV